MKKALALLCGILALALLPHEGVRAQSAVSQTSCGTTLVPPGPNSPLITDKYGNLCTNAGGGGGGVGGAVYGQNGTSAMSPSNPFAVVPGSAGFSIGNTGFNALQGGAANSLSNPFYVSPATGSLQAVQGSQSNAGAGTTGANNIGSNSYNYIFTSGAWAQWNGTVAATESGVWTVQPGNTPNTTPWIVTNYGSAGAAFTQGTAAAGANSMNAAVTATTGSTWAVVGPGASGSALSGNPVRGGLSDGTNTQNALDITGVTNAALAANTQKGVAAVGAIGYAGFSDTSTALGANGTFNGTFHTPPPWASYFGCAVSVNGGTGTLYINNSTDVVAQTVSQAVTAPGHVELTVRIRGSASTYNCQYVNGSTAQTGMVIESSFTAN